jgi:NAD(P)-dependent dehydrogenase (short-subunit alcohol dehydrogenase family)
MKPQDSTPSSAASFGLAGKSVLVVGASRGIGEAIARAFAAQGSKVMLGARDVAALERLAQELDPSGGRVRAVSMDVTDAASVQAAVAATVAAFGRLDVAVNNAGVQNIRVDENGLRTSRQAFIDTPDEAFDRLVNINLRGVFLAMKHELRAMLANGGGSIVNMASVAALVGFARIAPYVATKHGVIGLTKTAALEYAEQGIRVNALVPGTVLTEMLKAGPLATPEGAAQIMANIPMKRVASVEEVAGAVLWLASDLATYVTGAALPIDGGYVAA